MRKSHKKSLSDQVNGLGKSSSRWVRRSDVIAIISEHDFKGGEDYESNDDVSPVVKDALRELHPGIEL